MVGRTPPKQGGDTGPEPDTSRRLEIEQARRTRPVQAVRRQLRNFGDKDEGLRLLAEGIRRLLHQK